jgi:zinc transporter
MSGGRPFFAFAFHNGLAQSICDYADTDIAAGAAGFVWLHLDLGDAAAQAWLSGRPWPADVVQLVSAPIQRGRLFITQELIYGHLRDFREIPGSDALQAGSLSLVASRTMLVTGRRIPLRSVEELRRRVEGRAVRPDSPFALITEFFRALNDIGEGLLQEASDRLTTMESKVLKRGGAGQRESVLEMRGASVRVARDMAYKRTAMLELAREHPALLSVDEFDRFNHQIHRYAAMVEDVEDYAEHCQFLLEELRAQVEEETNRNLYILTMVSVTFLPATLIASVWGTNVGGIPFGSSPNGFWIVCGLTAAVLALGMTVLLRMRLRLF